MKVVVENVLRLGRGGAEISMGLKYVNAAVIAPSKIPVPLMVPVHGCLPVQSCLLFQGLRVRYRDCIVF